MLFNPFSISPNVLETQDRASKDRGDSDPDLLLENERDDGDEDDVEETDAVLDEQKGEVVGVRQVDFGHVHVHWVGYQENNCESWK